MPPGQVRSRKSASTPYFLLLTWPNMPPGQEPNVEVDDQGNGHYVFKLLLKAPARDHTQCICIALCACMQRCTS